MGRFSCILLCVLMVTIPLTGCMSENESNNNNDSDVNPVNNYYFYNNTTIIEPIDGLTSNQTEVSDTINNFNNSTYSDYYNYTTLLNNYTTLLNNYTTLQEQYNYSYNNYTNNSFYNYTNLVENQMIYSRGGKVNTSNYSSETDHPYESYAYLTIFETNSNETIQILSAHPTTDMRQFYEMRLFSFCGLESNRTASLENLSYWGPDFQGIVVGSQGHDPTRYEGLTNSIGIYAVPFYLPNPPSNNGCQHILTAPWNIGAWSISYTIHQQSIE